MKWEYLIVSVAVLIIGVHCRPNGDSHTKPESTGANAKPTNIEITKEYLAHVPVVASRSNINSPTVDSAKSNVEQIESGAAAIVSRRAQARIEQVAKPPTAGASALKHSIRQVTSQLTGISKNVSSSLPIIKRPEEAKKLGESDDLTDGHAGVAVPVSLDYMEHEMDQIDIKLKESSTTKDNLSTWVLLSGSNSTPNPNADPKGPTYKTEPAKPDKPKVPAHPNKPTPNSHPKPSFVPKRKLTTTTTSKPVNEPAQTKKEIKKNESTTSNQNAQKKKNQLENKPVIETTTRRVFKPKRKPTPTTTTTEATTVTTTTPTSISSSTLAPIPIKVNNENIEESVALEVSTDEPESTTFIVLEPKDADFDLPQDRSPDNLSNANKKTKPKRKPVKKNNKVAVSKKPKQKEKPMTTKIYNYLSREVMPTVGVGLVGLMVTAGLATYFLGPFGALRRSYDINDRKDDLYNYNNEEYAGADGQSEEEMFGKVIAGMPLNALQKTNIRYNQQQTQQYRPNNNRIPYMGQQVNKYPQHRYPNVQYRYTQHGAPVGTQQPAQQPAYRYNYPAAPIGSQSSRQNIVPASPSFNIGQLASTAAVAATTVSSSTEENSSSSVSASLSSLSSFIGKISDESVEIVTSKSMPSDEYVASDNSNTLQRRSQFVVGSILPEEQDTVGTVSVPEHGPRRRRRDTTKNTETDVISKLETDIKDVEQKYEQIKKVAFGDNKKFSSGSKVNNRLKQIQIELFNAKMHFDELKELNKESKDGKESEVNELKISIKRSIKEIQTNIRSIEDAAKAVEPTETTDVNSTEMPKDSEKPITVFPTVEPTTEEFTTIDYDYNTTHRPNPLFGFFKLLELKAQFGLNVLRSIRPAFERAFQDVFSSKRNCTESMH